MLDVVIKEIIKWLNATIFYPLVDSKEVRLIMYAKEWWNHYGSKYKNKLILLRLITSWRVFIECRRLMCGLKMIIFGVFYISNVKPTYW